MKSLKACKREIKSVMNTAGNVSFDLTVFSTFGFVLKLSYLNSMYLSVLNNFLVCYTVYTLCITLIVTCEVMIVLCLQHNVVCFLLEIITSITPWYVAFKTTILNSYVVFCGWFIITHLKHLLLLDTSGFLFFR